mmetsp:Transcript_1347/g.2070  ORF Transcript_1347/g.2070 Transcript_1347/m.2070 type:complete len:321 (+) Transcript_1347:275-1237(+)|eukprot:CAMPEP_0204829870 /NCGR_PEP_ID=MMETSP1346-20131115/8197_1 /ASSEMBLY_ACC=CAM_ASM_000771 /TAXON_ID=215587 /ORGANISM="Aplanochytrium stocchinoi, Strain GSBS06" /LENGTH=320 /DNA_ID=CAMNT_0051959961 /DNA_START=220 /DNA_END=1182 /DNA_ORIENTATION=-
MANTEALDYVEARLGDEAGNRNSLRRISLDKDAITGALLNYGGSAGSLIKMSGDTFSGRLDKYSDEEKPCVVILIIFIFFPLMLGLIIALNAAACVVAVLSGGALLDNSFNVTVDKETYLPNAAKLGTVGGAIVIGSMLCFAFLAGLIACMLSACFEDDSNDRVTVAKTRFNPCSGCLVGLITVATMTGGLALMFMTPYFLAEYAEIPPSHAYVAFGIYFGLQIVSGCLFGRQEEKGENENENEKAKADKKDKNWENFKFFARWGMHVVSAAIIYKALTNSGRIPDVDGMLQVSCIFGAFFQPLFVAFLPFFYPEAFIGA